MPAQQYPGSSDPTRSLPTLSSLRAHLHSARAVVTDVLAQRALSV